MNTTTAITPPPAAALASAAGSAMSGAPAGPAASRLKLDFLAKLKLWQKFALIGVVALALAAVPLVNLVQRSLDQTDLVRAEQEGFVSITATLELLKAFQDHRGSASYFVLGDEKGGAKRPQHAAAADAKLAALEARLGSIDQPVVRERLAEARRAWTSIKDASANRKIDQRAVTEVHNQAIANLFGLTDDLSAWYKLDLVPDPATHYMVRAALLGLPQLSETIGQLRAPVVSRLKELAAARKAAQAGTLANPQAALQDAFRPSDRARVSETLKDISRELERYVATLQKAMSASPEVAAASAGQVDAIRKATAQVLELVTREIVAKELPTIDPDVYLKEVSVPREAIQKLATQQQMLEKHLEQRLADTRQQAWLTIGGALLLLLVACAIAFVIGLLIVRNITGTVRALQRSVEQVRAGDFDALQAIEARDEVGDLGRTVNDLLQERIAAQRKAEDENERLNNSVISILQAVNQLSQRDLTARAPVTQDVVGTVSDSINLLSEETAKVLLGVNKIADQVAQVSGKVRSRAELVSKTAQMERQSVGQMIESLAEATQTTNQMTTLAEQSNRDAEQATQVTDTALETVNGTVKGMESIRETIAETEKRIKRLGERSQEITGIVNLINTISERTHVLALNASMQAAVAGEAGRGFAVVAEEVQRLAESSRNASQQIGTLVSNIQLETNETIATVNRTIGQVVQGSELAQKAGEQMRRTQEITAQLVAQVRRIGDSAGQQKAMSTQLLQAVQRIGQSTERTAQQIEAQNQETESLMKSARTLVESVGVFKLPQAAA